MPSFIPPIRSGRHRIAAIALYRALLTQCHAFADTAAQRDELLNVVRHRFKQARHSHSTRRLAVSFTAGYEAVDHLDAAIARNEQSRTYLLDLLERAPARLKVAPTYPTCPVKEAAPVEPTTHQDQAKPLLFNRPLPLSHVSGKRHVPVLFNANGIPVLRIKKPQPESLSRFLRQRIEQRQNRHDRRWRLSEDKSLADREDEWDDLLEDAEEVGMKEAMLGDDRIEPRWTQAIEEAMVEVQIHLNEEKAKNRVMAEQMQAVVDRETDAFNAEKVERLKAKRNEHLERKRQRSGDSIVEEGAQV